MTCMRGLALKLAGMHSKDNQCLLDFCIHVLELLLKLYPISSQSSLIDFNCPKDIGDK